mmetsp:Transcript_11937/g.18424  ORF Transcript_11937/g.18424 Transcript_11937/m.18424 type:complete len:140 (+) Transcript_11937:1348-1767(+)
MKVLDPRASNQDFTNNTLLASRSQTFYPQSEAHRSLEMGRPMLIKKRIKVGREKRFKVAKPLESIGSQEYLHNFKRVRANASKRKASSQLSYGSDDQIEKSPFRTLDTQSYQRVSSRDKLVIFGVGQPDLARRSSSPAT